MTQLSVWIVACTSRKQVHEAFACGRFDATCGSCLERVSCYPAGVCNAACTTKIVDQNSLAIPVSTK
eukprot:2411824-Amphidinium_carterae.1